MPSHASTIEGVTLAARMTTDLAAVYNAITSYSRGTSGTEWWRVYKESGLIDRTNGSARLDACLMYLVAMRYVTRDGIPGHGVYYSRVDLAERSAVEP